MEQETTFRMDEINPYIILKDLLWNLPFIILAVITVLLSIRTYKNLVYVPEYTANTTMAVMAKGSTDGNVYSSLNTASSMAEVFAEVFQSEVLKEKIEETLGKMPEGTKIRSELIPETNLLLLHVTTQDPQSAYRILQEILNNYSEVSDYIFGNAVLEVIMEPEVPVAPSNTFQTSRLDKIGILGVVALMVGVIGLLSVLRGTVKTAKAAKRHLDGECLAVLPYEEKNRTFKTKIRRTNKAVLLTSPVISFGYEEECNRLASRLEHRTGKKEQKVILITSVAENEGKSTVAANLAMAMARRNKKVLLVDMDFAKPALYKVLESKNEKNQKALALLKGEKSIKDVLQYDKETQIYTILNKTSVEDLQKYLCAGRLETLLAEMKEMFDYIIMDTAPVSAGTDTEYLWEYTDASVLVIRKDKVRISDLNDIVEQLKESEAGFLGYVLNDFEKVNGAQDKYGYGNYVGDNE